MVKSKVLLTTLAVLLSLGTTAVARTHAGTVVLDSGERIEQAEYMVKLAFKIVEVVEVNGVATKRKFSFDRIVALIDKNGKNVTKKYLGRFAPPTSAPEPMTTTDSVTTGGSEANSATGIVAPEDPADSARPAVKAQSGPPESRQTTRLKTTSQAPEETWQSRSERKKDSRPSQRKLWNFAIRAGGNFSSPAGSFYEGTTGGAGFGADIVIPLSHNAAIRGTVSRSGLKWDNSYGFFFTDPNLTILSQDNSLTATRISASAEYYFYSHKSAFPPKVVGFLYSGIGAVTHNTASTITVRNNTTAEVATVSANDSFTKFISVTGVGADFFLTPNFGLEVAGNIDMLYLGKQGSNSPQYAFILDLRIGVITFF